MQRRPGRGDRDFRGSALAEWTGKQFAAGNALLFIGACGIAVRSIAPHVKDKLSDVPVLVADEAGQFVIPLLAGHYGGANRLAGELSRASVRLPCSPRRRM